MRWFAGHPAEAVNGVCLSPLFSQLNSRTTGSDDTVFPAGTVYPKELSHELSSFLLKPDEIDSQTIALFVPRFQEVDQHNDRRLASIADILAECFSVHAAATWIMENRPWDFMGVYYQTIDQFSHGFVRYHPPRREGIDEHEYLLYQDTVNSAYRLHDLLLGRLMALAGEETTIILCSDHGFHIGDQRPLELPGVHTGPSEEHRPVGIFAMNGPGIKADELLHGASILDIVPTILHLFGLPVGQDMDGKPLLDAFMDNPGRVHTISTWETLEGNVGMPPADTPDEFKDMRLMTEQFIELGYVERREDADQLAVMDLENRWNLARMHHFIGRHPAALPILEELYEECPLRLDFGLTLAECRFRVGLNEEAHEIMTYLISVFPGHPRAQLLQGVAEHYRGNHDNALAFLQKAQETTLRQPVLFIQLGLVFEVLKRHADAIEAYGQALTIDPDTASAHIGTARCLYFQRAYEEAAEAALRSIALEYNLAPAHFILGKALIRLGQFERAAEAFEV